MVRESILLEIPKIFLSMSLEKLGNPKVKTSKFLVCRVAGFALWI